MKAIVRETYGPPDVLRLEDVPRPAVRDGDVLVKVRAASANAGDWHLLRGTPLPARAAVSSRDGAASRLGWQPISPISFGSQVVSIRRPSQVRRWPVARSADRAWRP